MSHTTGRVVAITPVVIGPAGPTPPVAPGVWEHTLVPGPAPLGGAPRFVILHLSAMNIPAGAQVEVPLGYDQEVYTAASGPDVWTRPIDTANPIRVRFVGGAAGSVTLAEYGSGEPMFTDYPPGQEFFESTTNPDLFLHTNPYQEPTYQTWLRCGGTFDWQNAAAAAAGSVQEQTARAVGMFVHAGHGHEGEPDVLSTCTGTLIDTNLFLTARHCAVDADELDIRSGSVTFDYQTMPDGSRPPGYAPRFYKVRRVAAAGGTVSGWNTVPNGDWLILELEQLPVGVTPRPMRGTAPMAGEPVFAVHHPNAAVKKLQAGSLSSASVTSVVGFDYAGGSSGSALFDAAGNVLGAALASGANAPDTCEVGYTPARAVLDALAVPPAAPTPFDVMLVVDRSGSMSDPGTAGGTKMDEAREAASLFVQLVRLNAGDKLGMVSFSTTASDPVDEAPGNVNPGQKNQLVGPSPYTTGKIGALSPGGATSIGGGLQKAMSELPPSANRRAIVLLTDGMQNVAPMVADVEPSLGNTAVHAIGFGSDAQLDGALLNRLAHAHSGLYTRAADGLQLKKFFALCFGNIFEAGMLADPTLVLPAGAQDMVAVEFDVCDEDRITAVVGWETEAGRLDVELVTPSGAVVVPGTPGTESDRGRTWRFVKVPLPLAGQREGTWLLRVRRPPVVHGSGEFATTQPASAKDPIRYVVSVLADGGPRLVPMLPPKRLYTGDPVNPKVVLQYANGTTPGGEVTLEVERLDGSLGALVERAGLRPPLVGEEPMGAFAATLRHIAQQAGGALPVATVTERLPLFDDALHDDGGLEPDGIFANPQSDLLRYEGTYSFRAVATYGHDCKGRREAMWSLHVLPGIDPDATDVEVVGGGIIRIRPRDRYGNPLGPGRGDGFGVTGVPGTTVTGGVVDNGDGSYDVPVSAPGGGTPGVVVTQPDRDPVVLVPGSSVTPGGDRRGCLLWLVLLLLVLVVVLAVALVASS